MSIRLNRSRLSALCGALGMIALVGVTRAPVGASTAVPRTVTVTMTDSQFTPAVVHVHVGETVIWSNPSHSTHTVTGEGFDSGTIDPGGTYSRTFEAPGSYPYHCKPHQSMGMAGTVVVETL